MTGASSEGGETITFRDPAGSVMRAGERIFRAVNEAGRIPLANFLRTQTASRLLASGRLVQTTEFSLESATNDLAALLKSLAAGASVLYEHSPVWFPSYPYEWPPEMLYAAAELTLEIAESSLDDGFCLKDATPFNVLFDRAKPVFVDMCSFEKRDPRDPIWLACSQFERMFLLPLLASRHFHVDPQEVFLANLDGIDADRLRQWFHFPQILHPNVVDMVLVPHLLNRVAESKLVGRALSTSRRIEPVGATKLLRSLLSRLRSKLRSVKPARRTSDWSHYDPAEDEVGLKSELVGAVLSRQKPRTVLDVGCNTGTYSRIAARSGARVVAIDSDSTVVGRVWRSASSENLDILPLVASFSRPSPGMGWRNAEYFGFEQRARQKFDAVLMLAVLHHIVVRDRIPMEQIFETVASYTKGTLVIEFVAAEDPMFQRISRGRHSLFSEHTEARFLAAAAPWFHVEERKPLPSGTRCLFVMRRHSS